MCITCGISHCKVVCLVQNAKRRKKLGNVLDMCHGNVSDMGSPPKMQMQLPECSITAQNTL